MRPLFHAMIPIVLAALNPNLVYGVGIVIAAAIAAVAAFVTARIVSPSQKKQQEAAALGSEISAAEAAVRSVREALEESRGRITSLERQVVVLTDQINELQKSLQETLSSRASLEQRLNSALAERATLKQRIADLELKVAGGEGSMNLGQPDAIVMTDLITGEIHYTSEGVVDLFGYMPKDLIGQPIETLIPEHLREIHAHERVGYSHHPRIRPMGTGIELLGRKRDGNVIPIDISLYPTSDGRVLALIKARRPTNNHVGGPSTRGAETSNPPADTTSKADLP